MTNTSIILIADSGSTKTDWRLIDHSNKIHQFRSKGINPYFQTSEQIALSISTELLPIAKTHFTGNVPVEVFFYGAGCSNEEKCAIVKKGISSCLPSATIHVEHDLLAAARSLCGKEEGIAAILGTGSNSCHYDGVEIQKNSASLGYVLGDEGSGAFIGKQLIRCYLYKELPDDLEQLFFTQYKLTKDLILERVYGQPGPNTFLASFTPFLLRHISNPFAAKLVYESFAAFLDHHICKYEVAPRVKMHCTGSVGFYFGGILRKAAIDRKITVGTITESPIAGLTLYHLPEL